MSGRTIAHYEVLEKLGEGGMGVVYKARDTRLGRTLALKVLPPGLASDPQRRRRFEHKARAASALNHPHICTLYDIGTAEPSQTSDPKIDYITMQFLEGQSLA